MKRKWKAFAATVEESRAAWWVARSAPLAEQERFDKWLGDGKNVTEIALAFIRHHKPAHADYIEQRWSISTEDYMSLSPQKRAKADGDAAEFRHYVNAVVGEVAEPMEWSFVRGGWLWLHWQHDVQWRRERKARRERFATN